MQQALAQIYQKMGRATHHDYTTGPLILDVDLTGLPRSKNYEAATKGYFANSKRGTIGRQLIRVNANQYVQFSRCITLAVRCTSYPLV